MLSAIAVSATDCGEVREAERREGERDAVSRGERGDGQTSVRRSRTNGGWDEEQVVDAGRRVLDAG